MNCYLFDSQGFPPPLLIPKDFRYTEIDKTLRMKTIIKIILLVALAGAVFLQHSLVTKNPPTTDGVNQEITVALKIDFGDGNISNYDGVRLGQEKTVFSLLKKVAEENNMEFSFKEYPDMGALVESIGNVKNDFGNNKWWQYWVNGEYANVGASSFQLKNNDSVEWKYVEGQF